jgi:nickel-dependent lactate racemase
MGLPVLAGGAAMKVEIEVGQDRLALEVPESRLVPAQPQSPAPVVSDLRDAVRKALEEPIRFPSLRRALTPDDHVTVVLDEHLTPRPELLIPLFEHLASAQIGPPAVTLVSPTEESRQRWLGVLPESYRGAKVETHDPQDRRHLSYLATTRGGRRIYLNRSAVEADQLVVLTRRGYDPLLGYAGSEGALYPVLSDEGTQRELAENLSMAAPEEAEWPVREEAGEVAWLLGAPFLIQIIDGTGESVAHVVGGTADSSADGQQLLNSHWRTVLPQRADTVVASLSGDPRHHDFHDLAHALACASRIVKPNGRIVLLSHAACNLGPGAEILRQTDDPNEALTQLREHGAADLGAAFQWANAVQEASVYLLSNLPAETAEELFVTHLENARQVQRLIDTNGTCVFLPDAHKTLAVVES